MSRPIAVLGASLLALGCGFVVSGSMHLTLRPDALATKVADTCKRGDGDVADGDQTCLAVFNNANSEQFVTPVTLTAGERIPPVGATVRYAYDDRRVRSQAEVDRLHNGAMQIGTGAVYLLVGAGLLYWDLRGVEWRWSDY